MSRLVLVICVLVATIDFRAVAQQPQTAPANLDFENGTPGQAAFSWYVPPQQPGVSTRLSTDDHRRGMQSVVLTREAIAPPNASVNVWQEFDATTFRGRRVRFRLAVKTDTPSARAQMWLRIEGATPPGGTPAVSFLDNMDDRPISRQEWGDYEIVADVPATAARIALGIFVVGTGRAWADDGTFEAVGKAESRPPEAPRAVTRRGMLNLLAFTRLLGAVRYFHPSDEVARADWDAFAIAGMRAVEASPDAAALVRQLEVLFKPIAPTLLIVPAGTLPRAEAPADGGVKLLAWRHAGLGTAAGQAPYRSERVPATEPAAMDIELGGGVSARLPLTVIADSTGTLPRGTAPAAADVPQPTRLRFSAADRGVRLASVALAWNALEFFYPYFDVVKTDWPAALRTALQEASTDRDAAEFAGTLKRMVAALRDGQARVIAGNEADSASLPSIALDWIEDKLVVTSADPATGVAAGDVVIAIDGTPAPLAIEGMEALISGATPQWIRGRAVQEILAGPKGTQVRLRIDKVAAPGTPVEVSLPRTMPGFAPPPRLDKLAELEPGILYLDLARLTDADLMAALPMLSGAKGLVFDARGSQLSTGPDALFAYMATDALASPQWHVPVVVRPDREQLTFSRGDEWKVVLRQPTLTARRAFLSDYHSIGYAETVLGIVEAYKLGEIVGGPTAGTNGVTNRFRVPGDFTIVFTGTKALKQNGAQHHGIGTKPTIAVSRTRAGVAEGRDEILERALQAVK
ncbi:MAG TPA: S41 family peptidase [Vicinamibacterales bacterium]|nr:S41 family peptidase [Vicinamibacterales bacterium]